MTKTPKVGEMGTELPSPREALSQAYAALMMSGDVRRSHAWIQLARELREGSTAPEQPADRLTLHDVEGIVCAHGRVAVRRRLMRKGDETALWWRHADGDATVCDDVQQETESMRRNGAERTDEQFWQGSRPTSGLVIEMPDRIAGYQRGQLLPPTPSQIRYASDLRGHLAAGRAMPFKLPEGTRDVMRSLVDEIMSRAPERAERIQRLLDDSRPERSPEAVHGSPEGHKLEEQYAQTTPSDLDQTAILSSRARVSPVRPAAVPPLEYGSCVHCGGDVYRVAPTMLGEPVSYRHNADDQKVCQGQRTPEGDETFVHTFAWPASRG